MDDTKSKSKRSVSPTIGDDDDEVIDLTKFAVLSTPTDQKEQKEQKEPVADGFLLQGALSMSEHIDQQLEMHVYIIGDDHQYPDCERDKTTVDDRCTCVVNNVPRKTVWITNFMYQLAKQGIDIFLETDITDTEHTYTYGQGYLMDHVFEMLQQCFLTTAKGKAACRKEFGPTPSRVHAVDVRLSNTWKESKFSKPEANAYTMLATIGSSPKPSDVSAAGWKIIDQEMAEIRQWLLKYTDQPNTLIEGLIKASKILKQVEHVPHLLIRKELEQMLRQAADPKPRLTAMNRLVQLFYTNARDEKWFPTFKQLVRDAVEEFLDYEMIFMDVYLLARLFRTYNDVKKPKVRRAVIYVGEAHAKFYRNFLEQFGFKTKRQVTEDEVIWTGQNGYNRCIPLKGFSDPLFSDRYFVLTGGGRRTRRRRCGRARIKIPNHQCDQNDLKEQ